MKFLKIFAFCAVASFAASFESLNQADLDRVSELMHSGMSLHDQRLYDEALKKYFAVDSILPDNEVVLYEIANSYCSKGMDSLAIYYAHKSLSAKETEGAFTLLGDVYDNAGKPDSAMKYYDLGLSFFPKDHMLLYNRAVAFLRMGKLNEAFEDARLATRNTRKHEGSYFIAALLAFNLKNVDEFVSNGLYALVVGNNEGRQNDLILRFASLENFKMAVAKNDSLDAKQKKSNYNLFVREGILAIDKMNRGNVDNASFYKSLVSGGFAEVYCRYAFQKIDPIAFESWKFINKGKTNEFKKWIAEYLRGE